MEIAFVPRWILKSFSSNIIIQYQWNILISNISILSFFIIFRSDLILIINSIPHICLFKSLLNIDCPFCGTTRAFTHLAEGDFYNAIKYNIVCIIIALYFAMQIPVRVLSLIKNDIIETVNFYSKIFGVLILCLTILTWILKIINIV